ncbi:MAG TPA: hypothetical protein PLN52_17785 [Opitutaceae bacterium]|nr:hypothetical protein [Opitutaceae bacterium]
MKPPLKRTLIKGMFLWVLANGFFLYSRHQETGRIGLVDLRVVAISFLFVVAVFSLMVVWARRSDPSDRR